MSEKVEQVEERTTHDIPIFISETKESNMKIKHIVVPPDSITTILSSFQLEKEKQQEVVNSMAMENPQAFIDMDEEESHGEIILRLTQETIVQYLASENIIAGCQVYNSSLTKEGFINIDAYFVDENKIIKPKQEQVKKNHQRNLWPPVVSLSDYEKKGKRNDQ